MSEEPATWRTPRRAWLVALAIWLPLASLNIWKMADDLTKPPLPISTDTSVLYLKGIKFTFPTIFIDKDPTPLNRYYIRHVFYFSLPTPIYIRKHIMNVGDYMKFRTEGRLIVGINDNYRGSYQPRKHINSLVKNRGTLRSLYDNGTNVYFHNRDPLLSDHEILTVTNTEHNTLSCGIKTRSQSNPHCKCYILFKNIDIEFSFPIDYLREFFEIKSYITSSLQSFIDASQHTGVQQ
ncbi:MAG: hypothetical protein HQL56_12600 [Magnetococcales bacterium]|nr:hypothetical protein [Magnetococcales bacterium]